MSFHFARRQNFPEVAIPGDLWLATDTRRLFVAVTPDKAFFPSTSDFDFITHLYSQGLTIKAGLHTNLPASAPIGTIFLTTDSLQAFAGTGPSLIEFKIDVACALKGADIAATF